jgi:serine/threonine protein kinase
MAPRSLFKDYGGGIRQRPPRLEDAKHMEQITLEALGAMDQSSVFFAERPPRPVPNFKSNELQCSRMIGMGEFGVVCQVEALHDNTNKASSNCGPPPLMDDCPIEEEEGDCDLLHHNSQSCSALASLCWSKESNNGSQAFAFTTRNNDDSQGQQRQLRSDLIRLCSTQQPQGARRVAVKQLRPDLYFKKKCDAARDLCREAKFLKSLEHPNIVKLHGIISQPGKADFGILLDCLSLTLREQMRKWKEQEEEATTTRSIILPFWSTSTSIPQETQVLVERLVALLEVAQAMRYLHQQL